MRVFEFHFNPKAHEDLIFDSFCYEPENIYERRVGSLYMAGSLRNVLPQHLKFLDKVAQVIKEKYYSPIIKTPEKSLKESLRKANEFLENLAKSGDVSWLGNLSFATISLKDFELNFTKVGDLKIFLLRDGQIIDIDQKLKFSEIEPYPLKIFANIVNGKLIENDIILVLTKEISDFFQSQNLLIEIARLASREQNFETGLKKILNNKREELLKSSGVCLLIFLSKEALAKKRETLTQPKRLKIFSLKKVFSPIVTSFKEFVSKFHFRLPDFTKPAKFLKFPKIEVPKAKIKSPKFNKNLTIILLLLLFLILGSFIFQREKKEQLQEYQTTLNQIQEKVDQAKSFLILKEVKPEIIPEANSLLKESWEEILPFTKIVSSLPKNLSNQVLSLKETISKNLYELNKLEIIEEPELTFKFKLKEFVPQKIIFSDQNLYCFSPYSPNLFRIDKEGKGNLWETEYKFNSAVESTDSILFFSKPNRIIPFKNDEFTNPFVLKSPYSDSNLDHFQTFKSNLYLLDKKRGEIIKYPAPLSQGKDTPQLWLDSQTKKAFEAKSMALDGSIWVLNKDNTISRYYAGNLQENMQLDFFPYPKDISKISTSRLLPYLYLLEPSQKRIIILNKSGRVVKQFQSEKFNNLLDFTVSQDGKTIYLLNGLKVFQIRF